MTNQERHDTWERIEFLLKKAELYTSEIAELEQQLGDAEVEFSEVEYDILELWKSFPENRILADSIELEDIRVAIETARRKEPRA